VVYFCLDVWLGKIPIRFYHFIHGVIYLIVYLLFAMIYPAASGTNQNGESYIYSIIDFASDPGMSTLLAFAVLFLGITLWTVHYAMFLLATYVEHRVYKKQAGPFGYEASIDFDMTESKTESV
jgi:hypothetical protein